MLGTIHCIVFCGQQGIHCRGAQLACGYEIRKKLVKEIEKAKYFPILADETTGTSTCEQVSICIHFVDASGKLLQEFLGFV